MSVYRGHHALSTTTGIETVAVVSVYRPHRAPSITTGIETVAVVSLFMTGQFAMNARSVSLEMVVSALNMIAGLKTHHCKSEDGQKK